MQQRQCSQQTVLEPDIRHTKHGPSHRSHALQKCELKVGHGPQCKGTTGKLLEETGESLHDLGYAGAS